MDRPESTNEEVGGWFANGEPHPFRHSSGVLARVWTSMRLFAEFRWWHRHQVLFGRAGTLPRSSTRPNASGCIGPPEGIWQVVFADDLDENPATGVE